MVFGLPCRNAASLAVPIIVASFVYLAAPHLGCPFGIRSAESYIFFVFVCILDRRCHTSKLLQMYRPSAKTCLLPPRPWLCLVSGLNEKTCSDSIRRNAVLSLRTDLCRGGAIVPLKVPVVPGLAGRPTRTSTCRLSTRQFGGGVYLVSSVWLTPGQE